MSTCRRSIRVLLCAGQRRDASDDQGPLSGEAMVLLQTKDRLNGSRMSHSWYVTFEVLPKSGTLVRRRSPRLTKTFETEADAREFARTKFEEGLIVTAGTINPHLPRRAIPSADIPGWLAAGEQPDSAGLEGGHASGTKAD
jgi:hypothetical protein